MTKIQNIIMLASSPALKEKKSKSFKAVVLLLHDYAFFFWGNESDV